MKSATDPWRIAFVDHAPFLGGAEASLLEIVTHLDRRRFDPLVLLPAVSPLVPLLEARGIAWRDLALPRLVASPLAAVRLGAAARHLTLLARASRVEVIHTNTTRAHLVGALVPRIPLVWMLRDDTMPRWLFRALRRRPAALIANSEWTARHYGLAGETRAAVVHPGVAVEAEPADRETFRRRLGVASTELLVAQVGRLVRWKGQETFLRAAALVARAVPDARFLVVGGASAADDGRGGGAGYAAELADLARHLGLDGRCTMTGHLADMRAAYAGIDLVVHAPLRPEPFGRVLIEAMAAGVPVVAADDGGPREIVVHGSTGMLVTPGDVERLATAITALLADPAHLRALGRAGRRRVVECFDARVQTGRLAALYQRVLAGAAP